MKYKWAELDHINIVVSFQFEVVWTYLTIGKFDLQ